MFYCYHPIGCQEYNSLDNHDFQNKIAIQQSPTAY